MSDTASHGEMHHVKRVPKAEFVVYFVIIFTLAVLPHVVGWTFQALHAVIVGARMPRLSPVARAWKDAQAVTPMIFRG